MTAVPDGASPERLASERWFAGKGRRVARVSPVDRLRVAGGGLAVVEVAYEDGPPELYTLLEPEEGGFWAELLRSLAGTRGGGPFRLEALPALGDLEGLAERPLGIDQSNSSFVLGDRLVLKCYRRLWPGPHPEVELVTHLGGDARLPFVPAAAGSVHWGDPPHAVALLQAYVAGAEDGWTWATARLGEALSGRPVEETTAWAEEFGAITADLHGALEEGFGSRAARPRDLRAWREAAEAQLEQAAGLPGSEVRELAAIVRRELAAFESPREPPLLGRVHGDLHVGQVLWSPAGFHVVDFEGEPTKPPGERRALTSPLRDVASMVRSFDNLPRWTLRGDGDETKRRTAGAWSARARGRFLAAYGRRRAVDAGLLRAFEVEKAVYELSYAAAFLPEWMRVARPALHDLLGSPEPS